jgi:hypothetical protein
MCGGSNEGHQPYGGWAKSPPVVTRKKGVFGLHLFT